MFIDPTSQWLIAHQINCRRLEQAARQRLVSDARPTQHHLLTRRTARRASLLVEAERNQS